MAPGKRNTSEPRRMGRRAPGAGMESLPDGRRVAIDAYGCAPAARRRFRRILHSGRGGRSISATVPRAESVPRAIDSETGAMRNRNALLESVRSRWNGTEWLEHR